MPAQVCLIRMEYRGVLVDERLRKSRRAEMEDEIKSLMAAPILEGINPNSPDQVRDKLIGWKVTQAKTTDKRTLKKIRDKRTDVAPFINHILRCRKLTKLKSTYLDAKTHEDGRLRTAYRLFVTATGRGRSGTDVFDLGANLQNFPGSQRDWIIPDEGLVFWAADASQIEARVVAWESGDEGYVRAFLEGRDVHTEHAVAMFNVPAERVRDVVPGSSKTYRDSGKLVTHAWGYWISQWGLADRIEEALPELHYTVKDADKHIRALDQLRSGVPRWRLRIVEHLRSDRTLWTSYGRPRTFLGSVRASDPVPSAFHRAAVAHIPQSTAGDHMHGALVRIAKRLRLIPRADVLLYTHDEAAGQCRLEDIEEVKRIACEEIARPMPLVWRGEPLICPAEFGYGPNWKDTHA